MCNPEYHGNALNKNNLTGALPGSPVAGAFFPSEFTMLMNNAYPALG
jgi:cellulose 1,4-beta-cellobiosidase